MRASAAATVAESFPAFATGIGGHGTEDKDDRHDHDVLEQQHRQRGAADRCVGARNTQHQRSGGEGEGEPQRQRAGPVLAHHRKDRRQQRSDDEQLQRAQAEDQFSQLPQAIETEFQPDGVCEIPRLCVPPSFYPPS